MTEVVANVVTMTSIRIPKLFSAGNNMDTGSIPLELTVSKTLTIAC